VSMVGAGASGEVGGRGVGVLMQWVRRARASGPWSLKRGVGIRVHRAEELLVR
jgi:hypothetical protein